MKLILIPLFIIILIAISVQMMNFQTPDYSKASGTINNPSQAEQITTLGVTSTAFTLTLIGGFLVLFGAVAVIGILAGLNISVFGSTVKIDSRPQNIIYNSMFYGGLWGIFSVLATIGINGLGLFSLPIFGYLFYAILTLIYVLGINQQIQSDPTG